MTEGKSSPRMAGGIFLALGLLIGAGFGLYVGQPSLGMVVGFAVGVVAALLVWFLNRGS